TPHLFHNTAVLRKVAVTPPKTVYGPTHMVSRCAGTPKDYLESSDGGCFSFWFPRWRDRQGTGKFGGCRQKVCQLAVIQSRLLAGNNRGNGHSAGDHSARNGWHFGDGIIRRDHEK